jgi:hypothetical protein
MYPGEKQTADQYICYISTLNCIEMLKKTFELNFIWIEFITSDWSIFWNDSPNSFNSLQLMMLLFQINWLIVTQKTWAAWSGLCFSFWQLSFLFVFVVCACLCVLSCQVQLGIPLTFEPVLTHNFIILSCIFMIHYRNPIDLAIYLKLPGGINSIRIPFIFIVKIILNPSSQFCLI